MAFKLFRMFRGGAPVEAAVADHPLADDVAFVRAPGTEAPAEAAGLVGQSLSQNDVVDYVRAAEPNRVQWEVANAVRDAGPASHDDAAAARTAGPDAESIGHIKFDGVDGEVRAPGPSGMIHDTALAARDATPTAGDAGEPGKFFDVFLEAREAGAGATEEGTATQLKNVMVSSFRDDSQPRLVENQTAEGIANHGFLPERGVLVENAGDVRVMIDQDQVAKGLIEGGFALAHDEGPATLLSHAAGTGDLAAHAGDAVPHDSMSLNFEDIVHHNPVPDAPDGVVDLPDGADIDPLDI